jgi:hypothetical protein
MKSKILFIFSGLDKRPSFLTYGYNFLKVNQKNFHNMEFISLYILRTRFSFINKFIILYQILNINFFLRPKIIYLTSDGIALDFLYFHFFLFKKTKLIANAMGITSSHKHGLELYLKKLNLIICFSNAIKSKINSNKTRFLKYGTDFKYFYPSLKIKKENSIIMIGNDNFRDWELSLKIASELSNINFYFIGNKINKKDYQLKNIKFLGNLKYSSTKSYLQRSKLCLVFTKKNDFFSGETTILNSIASKTNVLFFFDENLNGYSDITHFTIKRNTNFKLLLSKVLSNYYKYSFDKKLYNNLKNNYDLPFYTNRLIKIFSELTL